MNRKVMRHGASSLSITLPSNWTSKYGIKQGDELHVLVQQRRLIVSTSKQIQGEKLTISVKKIDKRILRTLLASAHEYGYDEVEIFFDDLSIIEIIRYEQNLLLGYEIIEQTDKRCLLKSISVGLDTEFDNIFRRLFYVTLSLSDTCLQKLRSGNIRNITDILSLEETNNKLADFCERLINKGGYKDYRKNSFVYVTCWQLEKIGDEYRNLFLFLQKKAGYAIKISKNTLLNLERVNSLLRELTEIYFKFDISRMTKLKETKDTLISELHLCFEKEDLQNSIIISSLINISTRILDLSSCCIAMSFGED